MFHRKRYLFAIKDISVIIPLWSDGSWIVRCRKIPHIHAVNTSIVVGSKSDGIESKQISISFKLQYIKLEIWTVWCRSNNHWCADRMNKCDYYFRVTLISDTKLFDLTIFILKWWFSQIILQCHFYALLCMHDMDLLIYLQIFLWCSIREQSIYRNIWSKLW